MMETAVIMGAVIAGVVGWLYLDYRMGKSNTAKRR